jgi:exosortase/archaeosortase family protein
MTMDVSPTRLSVRRHAFIQPRDAIKYLSDRIVLTAAFITLFYLNYSSNPIEAFANNDIFQSRAIGGAEILGFVAIFVVLKDLKADRVLRWWDFAAIVAALAVGIVAALLYPSKVFPAISITYLGLLFIARSDKRIASLGQLCIGLAWIGFWGALVLIFVKQWLLPIETEFAFLPLSLFGSFSIDGTEISNGRGFSVDVFEGCSAFHNTIVTAFVWLSLIKIQKLDFRLKYFYVLAIGLVAVIVLNTLRISIMAVSEGQYLFWHEGPGQWIVKTLMLGGVLGLFYFGLTPHNPKPSIALSTARPEKLRQ